MRDLTAVAAGPSFVLVGCPQRIERPREEKAGLERSRGFFSSVDPECAQRLGEGR